MNLHALLARAHQTSAERFADAGEWELAAEYYRAAKDEWRWAARSVSCAEATEFWALRGHCLRRAAEALERTADLEDHLSRPPAPTQPGGDA